MNHQEQYRVIDLFAGPGGLGEGFASFGYETEKFPFKLSLSIEKDKTAYKTLELRSFYRQFEQENLKIPDEYWAYVNGEIARKELFEKYHKQSEAAGKEAQCIELGRESPHLVKSLINESLDGCQKWVLIGGPPCQAYSLVGRSRMGANGSNPDFQRDIRHTLYKEYLRIIADHRPPVFVMENVKGILSAKHYGEKIIEKILQDLKRPYVDSEDEFKGLGYKLYSLVHSKPANEYKPEDFVVRAEKFGIPQARHRVLILGIREDIKIIPEILKEQKKINIDQVLRDLPVIRSSVSREKDCMKTWREILNSVTQEEWFQVGRDNDDKVAVTRKIEESLIKINQTLLDSGADVLAYDSKKAESISHLGWYRRSCENVNIISHHKARSHMRSDLHRYFFASTYALVHEKSAQLGDFPPELLPAHKNVRKGSENDHFGDRFRVQVKGRPSTTITSHISKDGHYYIHYDPSQCRSLTVREAARLQTFPDSYKFEGNRTSQYHQVGNAVPPYLSMQVAAIVYDILNSIRE